MSELPLVSDERMAGGVVIERDNRERERAPRVVIMGAPIGIGNRGVSALGSALVRLFVRAHPEANISLLIGTKDAGGLQVPVDGVAHNITIVNYRRSLKAPLAEQIWIILLLAAVYRCIPSSGLRNLIKRKNAWIRTVANADIVGEIRGGDGFSDIYGLKSLLMGTLSTICATWIRGGVVLLPQTYGPYKTRIGKWLARYIISNATTVISRDLEGIDIVKALTRGKREALFCPDVAFMLEPIRPAVPAITPKYKTAPGRVLVGVNISGKLFHEEFVTDNRFGLRLNYSEFVESLCNRMLAIPGVDILLVPHTFAEPGRSESDNHACELVANKLSERWGERVHKVTEAYDQFHIKGVIGMCDFMIGSRMHACIAALSQTVPTVGVAYSPKFRGVFGSVGAEDWVVDGRQFDSAEAVNRIAVLFDKRAEMQNILRRTVPHVQTRLCRQFEELLSAVS